jgi:hypothetical protein
MAVMYSSISFQAVSSASSRVLGASAARSVVPALDDFLGRQALWLFQQDFEHSLQFANP